MSIFKLPKSSLYRGLARVYIVIAVAWTGVVVFWVWHEDFNVIRPDAKTVQRVDDWFSEIVALSPPDSGKFGGLPTERRRLIQKAADSGAYDINGRERKLTASEIKACKTILESGFSKQVKDTLVGVCSSHHIESVKSLSGLEYSDYCISHTPVWDFRGVERMNLETLSFYVPRVIRQLNEIQTPIGWEGGFLKSKPTGEFTGLITEKDLALLDDLRTAQKSRWILKPLFWVAAWIVPLLGFGLTTLTVAELCAWVVRGFRPTTQTKP